MQKYNYVYMPMPEYLPSLKRKIHLPTSSLEMLHTPSTYEYALLSGFCYEEHWQGDPKRRMKFSSPVFGTYALPDWRLLKKFSSSHMPRYAGFLFYNKKKNLLVLGFPGSKSFWEGLAQLRRSVGNTFKNQLEMLHDMLPKVLKEQEKRGAKLSLTGHSLGGSLAQLAVFLLRERFSLLSIKAVCFESFGIKAMLEKINTSVSPVEIDLLDITNYVSSPNLVNTCSEHIGCNIRIVFRTFNEKTDKTTPLFNYTTQSHYIYGFFHQFDQATGDPLKAKRILKWPMVDPKALQEGKFLLLGGRWSRFLHLFSFLYKSYTKRFFRPYNDFFKEAKASNHYDIDTHTLPASLRKKLHYHVIPYDPSYLHKRHIDLSIHFFLRRIFEMCPKKLRKDHPYGELLSKITWDDKTQCYYTPGYSAHLIMDSVTSILEEHPEWRPHLQPSLDEDQTLCVGCPPLIGHLVSRPKEEKALIEALHPQKKQLIVPVIGHEGTGKSQLVRSVIGQVEVQRRYKQVVWLEANSSVSLVLSLKKLAEKLCLPKEVSLPKLLREIYIHSRCQKSSLYVLEDVPNEAEIAHLLPPEGDIIMISRTTDMAQWSKTPIVLKGFSAKQTRDLVREMVAAFGDQHFEQIIIALFRSMADLPIVRRHLLSIIILEASVFLEENADIRMPELIIWLKKQDKKLLNDPRELIRAVWQSGFLRLTLEEKEILQYLGFCAPRVVPFDFLSILSEGALRHALVKFEHYALLHWDQKREKIHISPFIQEQIRYCFPDLNVSKLIKKWEAFCNHSERRDVFLPHGVFLAEHLPEKTPASLRKALKNLLSK